MPIEITLERRQLQLTRIEAALAKGATSRHALRRQFESAIAAKQALFQPVGALKVNEATLRWCIHRYSEQLVPDAMAQLKFFLALQHPLYFEPGFAPLFYFTHKSGSQGLSVSKSAVAAVAEGVGAIVMQRLLKARILCRPYHDFPDLIGTDAPSGSQITTSKLYLMEVKGHLYAFSLRDAANAGGRSVSTRGLYGGGPRSGPHQSDGGGASGGGHPCRGSG